MHNVWINNNCGKLVQGENTTIISKKDSDSNVFRKVIHKINTLWNKLVHSTIYCVKKKKVFVDRKKWRKKLSTANRACCEQPCE